MPVVGEVEVLVKAAVAQFEKDLRAKVGGAAETAGAEGSKRLSKTFNDGLAALAGGAAAARITGFLKDAFGDFAEAEQKQARLNLAFKQFPQLAGANAVALRKMNAELQRQVGIDDDALAGAEALLARYELTEDQIRQLVPLLVDYAKATGQDVGGAAESLGRALLGQGRALKAIGIDFKDTGSVAGNFAQIMAGLQAKVGGVAEELAATAGGRLEIIQTRFGELKEQIGGSLVPAFEVAADILETFAGVLEDIPAPVTTAVVALAGLTAAAVAVSRVITIIKGAQLTLAGLGTAGTLASQGIGRLARVAGAGALAFGVIQAADAVQEFWDTIARGPRESGVEIVKERLLAIANGAKTASQAFAEGRTAGEALDQALADLVRSGHADLAAQALANIQQDPNVVLGAVESYKEYQEALAEVRNQATLASDGQKKLAGATDAVTRASEEAAAAFEAQADAAFGLLDSNLSYFQSLSRIEDVQAEVTEKQKEYNDAVRQHGRNSREALDAQDALGEALRDSRRDFLAVGRSALQAATDQATLEGRTLTAAEKINIQRNALVTLASEMQPGNPLRAQLLGLIADLDKLKPVHTVNVQQKGITDARRAVALLAADLAAIGTVNPVLANRLRRAEGRAAGGRVWPGGAWSWREGGMAERLVTDTPGYVASAQDTRRLTSAIDRLAAEMTQARRRGRRDQPVVVPAPTVIVVGGDDSTGARR